MFEELAVQGVLDDLREPVVVREQDVPAEVRKRMKFIFAQRIDDVLAAALADGKARTPRTNKAKKPKKSRSKETRRGKA